VQKSKKILCNQVYHFIISGRYAASHIFSLVVVPDQRELCGRHYFRYYHFYYWYYGVTRAQ